MGENMDIENFNHENLSKCLVGYSRRELADFSIFCAKIAIEKCELDFDTDWLFDKLSECAGDCSSDDISLLKEKARELLLHSNHSEKIITSCAAASVRYAVVCATADEHKNSLSFACCAAVYSSLVHHYTESKEDAIQRIIDHINGSDENARGI